MAPLRRGHHAQVLRSGSPASNRVADSLHSRRPAPPRDTPGPAPRRDGSPRRCARARSVAPQRSAGARRIGHLQEPLLRFRHPSRRTAIAGTARPGNDHARRRIPALPVDPKPFRITSPAPRQLRAANCHFFRSPLKRNTDPPRSHTAAGRLTQSRAAIPLNVHKQLIMKESDIMGVLVEASASRKAA
jgi:hypothetical protein